MPEKHRTKTDPHAGKTRTKTQENGLKRSFNSPSQKTSVDGKNQTKMERTNQNRVFALPLNKLFISICFILSIRFCQFLSVYRQKGPKRTKTERKGIFAPLLSRTLIVNKMATLFHKNQTQFNVMGGLLQDPWNFCEIHKL